MDPNANLKQQLQRALKILRDADSGRPDENDGLLLAELVQALDEWIRRGGFLPDAWKLPELPRPPTTEFDPSRSLEFCPADCGAPIYEGHILYDSRIRAWHVGCAARALAEITRRDETRGDDYHYRWDW